MPQPKARPDSPVSSLQGPCDQSLKSDHTVLNTTLALNRLF